MSNHRIDRRSDAASGSVVRRLAIVGGGSSGLVTLKYALEELPDWEIVCFEKTESLTGCWGNPHPDFVSTSTKYATQFACHQVYDAEVEPGDDASRNEAFFRGNEYGCYLTGFAERFGLRQHVRLRTEVTQVEHCERTQQWKLELCELESGDRREASFDALVICTGLAAKATPVESQIPVFQPQGTASNDLDLIRGRRVVVMGGGESAVDFASRLARPDRENTVFLSLRSGVRVSPRYHPVRGVPSDFLRNRLMLSIDPGLRNWIGEWFVRTRIRYEHLFRRWFPGQASAATETGQRDTSNSLRAQQIRRDWDMRLTMAAKQSLFKMFHNKSDEFLHAVGEERIRIVGPPTDTTLRTCKTFDQDDTIDVDADLVVPAIGYRSLLPTIDGQRVELKKFYRGCCHVEYENLFLVGFARPIIGNIPTISEMQARYVTGMLSGRVARPTQLADLQRDEQQRRQKYFSASGAVDVYPVEMFPYCDLLAHELGIYPSVQSIGSLRGWWNMMTSPASTLHYANADGWASSPNKRTPVYMPPVLIGFLILLLPLSWLARLISAIRR